MVWRTNERLTRGNEIPKKSCRPLQGSAGAAGKRCLFLLEEEWFLAAGWWCFSVRLFQRVEGFFLGRSFHCRWRLEGRVFQGLFSESLELERERIGLASGVFMRLQGEDSWS